MAVKDIFVGDIGTHFICEMVNLVNSEAEAPLDISVGAGVTEKLVIFKKPDGTETEFAGAYVTDGTDGQLEYVTANKDDLDMEGSWEYYGWVKYTGGERRTSSVKFKVYAGRISELL